MNHLYLYVALVGVVIVLFALTRGGKRAPQSPDVAPESHPGLPAQGQRGMLDRELRATLDDFFKEIEQENERLMQTIADLENESREQLHAAHLQIERLDQRVLQLEGKLQEQASLLQGAQEVLLERATETQAQAATTIEPVVQEPQRQAFVFNDKYARVVDLSRQGLTAEQIARETNIGLGEIHFVLGLAKREEG